MTRHCSLRLVRSSVGLLLLLTLAACGGTTRRPSAVPAATPSSAPASSSVQTLYEAGRDGEVVARASATDPVALWFAAQSHVRLGSREDAARQLEQLAAVGGTPAWQAVADLALALLASDGEAIDRARAEASAHDDPFVQFELGLAHMERGDFPAAASAFDRCAELSPRFAYAYYGAGLAYSRLDRADLLISRLDTFLRLAPDAPEGPEVNSILRTARAR